MPETVDSFTTPSGNTWEKRVDSRGIEYAVASHKSNKQKVSSFNAAKAGAASAESREEKYGTSQPGKNEAPDPQPRESEGVVGPDFERVSIDPSDRDRTSPFDDLEQWKLNFGKFRGIPLDLFKSQADMWADRMAEVHTDILDSYAAEYFTHANWGVELRVEDISGTTVIKVRKAVSTPDIQANNIFVPDAPTTYHPRHTNHPGTNPDPGTNFRFIQLVEKLDEEAYEDTTVVGLWVELLKYPPEDE